MRVRNGITESYGRMGDPGNRFDVEFWQAQGPEAIFEAALDLVLDAMLLKTGHAVEPRLQRSVESFRKIQD